MNHSITRYERFAFRLHFTNEAYYMDIYTLFVKNATSREKERVIIIITIMHNIKDTITHFKQGRGPRRNGNRKLKRSDWCSWRTWPLHVECVLSHTHTKVCLPSAVCVCVWQKKGSLLQSQCDSSWMPLSADGSWHPGGQTGRMDEEQPPSQRKDACPEYLTTKSKEKNRTGNFDFA